MSDSIPEDEYEGRPELVRLRARAIFVQRLFIASAILAVTLVLGFLVYNAIVSAQTRGTLLDCVKVAGECAQRNAEQTGQHVQRLIDAGALDAIATRRTVLATAYCIEVLNIRADEFERLENCVNNQLPDAEKEKEK